MWRYEQGTGRLYSPHGDLYGEGYSGHGEGVNNPTLERLPKVGPIPRGLYEIGASHTDEERGPLVMGLTPIPDTNTFGRAGFLIHGDLVRAPGKELASEGCIVLGPLVRKLLAGTCDRILQVY